MKSSGVDAGRAPLPFDRVLVPDGRGERLLTAEEFLALPLAERIRCILRGSARFYSGATLVEQSAALQSLRDR